VVELAGFLDEGPFGLELGGVAGLVDRACEQLGDLGELAGPAPDAATATFEIVVAEVIAVSPPLGGRRRWAVPGPVPNSRG
jgi:hypothetical protein